ncbi:MAG TPA: serine hydrolase domain-containing protein [Flavilitoribacter sp.]|nr:serine hydrolase domain-containing protein [Flavilitoribacter sp.]HMQ90121.1 serine hydrolase domain-containing protein [Flavilitoribacter sp.]
MQKILLFILLPLVALQPVGAQTRRSSDPAIQEATRLIQDLMTEQRIPGISITILRNGKTLWSEGFGFADLENQSPVIPGKTMFRIGSVSKPFSAAALALLYEAGKVDLDAEVQTYVPYFSRKKYPVTVRQVAGHIAGIRHYRGQEFLSADRYPSVKESLSIFGGDTLLFEPGTKYSYSSYGWNLISAVIEGASGEDFLTYMQREVFDRLGMDHTSPDFNDSIIVGRTRYYAVNDKGNLVNAPYVDNSYKWAGGGFIATSDDVARFADAHMNPGFLKPSTLETWIQSQHLKDGSATNYGIGWGSGKDSDGRPWFGHTGGSVGGITMMRVYPAEKLVIAILSNSSDVSYGKATEQLATLFSK